MAYLDFDDDATPRRLAKPTHMIEQTAKQLQDRMSSETGCDASQAKDRRHGDVPYSSQLDGDYVGRAIPMSSGSASDSFCIISCQSS